VAPVRVSRSITSRLPGTAPVEQPAAGPLRGSRLIVARATWMVMAALAVSLFAAAVPVEFALLHEPCPTTRCTTGQLSSAGLKALENLGLSRDSFAAYFVAMDAVFAAVWFAVSALIFWRRSDDRIGLFASLALLTFGTATFTFTMEALTIRHPAWDVPVAFLHFFGSASFGLFLYLFPDGRFVPRWTRWVALVWIAWQLPPYFFPDWHLAAATWYLWAQGVVWTLGLGTALYAQAHRYRRVSGARQRQRIKLVVFGIVSALSVFIVLNLALGAFVAVPASPRALATLLIGYLLVYVALLLIPLSISIAMLRHHLFDVDLVINRTVVYGVLTASVVLLYVLVVGGLGALLRVQGSLIVSLIATGLAAVMFQPLRERLQRAVNRLMYGERDDPYAVLSRLGQRLESSLAPKAALPAAAHTVAEALKLPYVAVEVGRGGETVASAGEPVPNPLRLPLAYGGEEVGSLILGPRAGEEGFSPADLRLLEDLAHQLGVAVHAARLTDEAIRLSADLQTSRERLVTAREEERRRLRRDLHDGLGPQLASLTMTAEAARDLVSTDPARAEELLAGVMERAQDAVSDVRRLVYELRPPALDALGLLAALRAYADHHTEGGIGVTVESPSALPPLPAAVEVAAYRIAMEAINNVARHASARNCNVRLSLDEQAGMLALEVSDDGRGIEGDYEPGVGLSSMRERAEELGGSCTIKALPSGGTRVEALLPCALDGMDQTGLQGRT
jgi:signal transduction histidine kinase